MKKLFLSLVASLSLTMPVMADPIIEEWRTYNSMGCMLLRECKDGVKEIKSISDLRQYYPYLDFSDVGGELSQLFSLFETIGIQVFLADEKYFVPNTRGVYHTISNNLYLNEKYMNQIWTLVSVIRHEGWHAAQDCMAGTIDNSFIAVIIGDKKIPVFYQELAKRTYASTPAAIPWETEAMWAGRTEGVTVKALSACANGPMWKVYQPTPLTRKWLVKEGFIKE